MASLNEHCADCRRELGDDFKYVHEWIDALFKVLGPKHRSVRHHRGGVEEVRTEPPAALAGSAMPAARYVVNRPLHAGSIRWL